MSVNRTMTGVMNAANEMQTATHRLRLAVAESLRKEIRSNLPNRFQHGAVERYGYPPYAPSTLKRKTTPPLVETGVMRRAALSTLNVRVEPSNRIMVSVQGPHYLRIQHEAGRDILKPTRDEMRRITSRIRVLPSPRSRP